MASRSSISRPRLHIAVRPLAEHDFYSVAPAFVDPCEFPFDLRREVIPQPKKAQCHFVERFSERKD